MITKIGKVLKQYWGYDNFLSLQKEAMQCVANGRDLILVLPTGGGKSLCFQAPAIVMDGLAIVVSPLIALMKDQVDALTEYGVAAARIDSSLSFDEQKSVFEMIDRKSLKLLYVSPERLVSDGFIEILKRAELSFIAIDEAHCVSMWGHDFRPEYRQLGMLRKIFPNVAIGTYTATATEQVRNDIALQLKLKNPQVLIGSFDRPNLVYKVRQSADTFGDVCKVLDRYKGESGIIYCIRRKDVDNMCAKLTQQGYNAAPYHAGMTDRDRKRNQERFINEKIDTIVATIAFGMGIDKSNVRYVIHTGMSKSLEHYQQESGRAGRDGLEAECCLFYSGSDYALWKSLIRDMPEDAYKVALSKLDSIYRFCVGSVCRHKAILDYFGQSLEKDNCQACDICLGEIDYIDDALIVAQKIMSCIMRLEQRFGSGYNALVLSGSKDQNIIARGHNKLSTYGLLSDYSKSIIQNWTEQLIGQGYIIKTGEYNVLEVTKTGWDVLKGKVVPRLFKPVIKPTKVARVESGSLDGLDKALFKKLRSLRSQIATEKNLPAYIIFGDAALRDMARQKPTDIDSFLQVNGVGQKKCKQYGKIFIDVIVQYCNNNNR